MVDILIVIVSAIVPAVLLEILYWRRARKEGKKDLIDILSDKLKKK